MKRFDLLKILLVALVVTVATTGCRSRTKGLTPIPGSGGGITKAPSDDGGVKPTYTPGNTTTFNPPLPRPTPPPSYPPGPDSGVKFPPQPPINPRDLPPDNTNLKFPPTDGGLPPIASFDGMIKDAEIFKNSTVLFDYDSSVVKDKERSKIEGVAAYLKGNPLNKLLIEGHCDERGTEEYNRALGERRALAVREYLIRLGVQGSRIRTISFGFDKPVDPGHNETAWSKNRRGVFIVLMPR